MDIQFDQNNNIIKLLLRGMVMEDSGKPEDAGLIFLKAWSEATDDFERFIAAYYVALHQKNIQDKLKWLETSLQFALKINDNTLKSAFPSLYLNIIFKHCQKL
jgi:hypothetical protein